MEWIISNQAELPFHRVFEGDQFTVFSPGKDISITQLSFKQYTYGCFFEGYFLSRAGSDGPPGASALLKHLFKAYGFDFIHHIKGVFNIVIFAREVFRIYTDHHGIQKYFMSPGSNYIISNKLRFITSHRTCEVDPDHIAIQSLFNHYINGITFLKDISYNRPGSYVQLENGRPVIEEYFSYHSLLEKQESGWTYSRFADHFSQIVAQYSKQLGPGAVSLTLTGGKDSRTILAALLAGGITPNTFTYGSDLSADVVYAREIAGGTQLGFRNYFPEEVTANWFRSISDEVIDLGQSVVHLHRAHRVDAIKQLSSEYSSDQLFFGGYMGGELLMGVYYDNLIITNFVKRWIQETDQDKDLIRDHLVSRYLLPESIDLEYIRQFCTELPFFSGDQHPEKEFHLQFQIGAFAHHLADIYMFMNYLHYPVAIFLDIDFLEMLFSSEFHFMKQNNSTRNPFKRVGLYELSMNLQHRLAPQLSTFRFAKKGSYSTEEYLGNKLALISKRAFRRFREKSLYGSNFPLTEWMEEYVDQEFNSNHNPEIPGIFDFARARSDFRERKFDANESSWHRYTDIIMLNKLITRYNRTDV